MRSLGPERTKHRDDKAEKLTNTGRNRNLYVTCMMVSVWDVLAFFPCVPILITVFKVFVFCSFCWEQISTNPN